MSMDNRKMLSPNATKPLNLPEPLSVEEGPSGVPKTVKLKQRHFIISIEDYWRIDDEWWRSEPVSRLYYAVILDSGRRIVISKNLINNYWCQQTY
jgi:hypothetical protein